MICITEDEPIAPQSETDVRHFELTSTKSYPIVDLPMAGSLDPEDAWNHLDAFKNFQVVLCFYEIKLPNQVRKDRINSWIKCHQDRLSSFRLGQVFLMNDTPIAATTMREFPIIRGSQILCERVSLTQANSKRGRSGRDFTHPE